MKVSSSRKVRLYIKTTINGKPHTAYMKSRVFDFAQRELSADKENRGKCLIVYDSKNDYWNEFTFSNLTEFKKQIATNTELELLKFLENGE
jgi:hypothetical protein